MNVTYSHIYVKRTLALCVLCAHVRLIEYNSVSYERQTRVTILFKTLTYRCDAPGEERCAVRSHSFSVCALLWISLFTEFDAIGPVVPLKSTQQCVLVTITAKINIFLKNISECGILLSKQCTNSVSAERSFSQKWHWIFLVKNSYRRTCL